VALAVWLQGPGIGPAICRLLGGAPAAVALAETHRSVETT
jgi:hypothetical protein